MDQYTVIVKIDQRDDQDWSSYLYDRITGALKDFDASTGGGHVAGCSVSKAPVSESIEIPLGKIS